MNAETPADPVVRPATPDDAEAIARVHVTGWQEAYVGLLPQHVLDRQSVPTRTRNWTSLLQQPPNQRWTFVAVDSTAGIVGFAGGVRAKSVPFGVAYKIPVLYVLGSHHRRGLGARLLRALGAEMARHGDGPVGLWSLAENRAARTFYERVGGRLVAVLAERDNDTRTVLAGYRWPSAAALSRSGVAYDAVRSR